MKPNLLVPGLFVVILLCAAAGAGTIYVDDEAPGFGDGSSWENAYRYLQDALAEAEATEGPVEIRVAQGLYRPDRSSAQPVGTGDREATFQLINGVTLQGGYAGLGGVDPNARDVDRYETILSGDLADNDPTPTARTTVFTRPTGRSRIDNSRHVVTILEAPSQVILDGFTITAAHCFLSAGRHATGSGGGINSYASHVAIRNCTFERNFAADRGAATYVEEGTVHVEDCVFTGNVASRGVAGEGGALACRRAHVTIIDTSFIANAAVTGGAVLGLDCPSLEISNCLFAGNVSFGTGAALASLGSQVALKQCTLSENGPSDALFGGSSDDRQASFRITGCIFPKDTISISKHFAVVAEVAYSNMFHGVIADPCNTLVWGPGNVNMEPFFADPGYWDSNGTPDERKDDFWVDGDYHLKSQAGRWDPDTKAWVQDDVTSPCIDAGDPNSPVGHEPFPNGGRINMGAYGGTSEASKSPLGLHAKYGGGTGVPNDPYLIYTAQHLNALGAEPDDWDRHFKLVADIDLAGYWYDRAVIAPDTNDLEPLFQGTPFTGVFDGGGHTISHLRIEGVSLSALFGQLGQASWLPDGGEGEVRNLGLIEPTVFVTGEGRSAGALVGCLSRGTVVRCYVEGGLIDASLGNGVGGLVGSNSGTVTGCNANVKVTGTYHVGGLVGRNSGTVTACHATVTGTGTNWVGGLAGSNSGALVQCFSLGRVSGGDHVGGLTGWNDGTITDCYTTAAASGSQWVGGLAGVNVQRGLHPDPGGSSTGQVYHSYSAGPVSGDFQVGGLCGSNGGSITNCFWDVETSGRTRMCGHDDAEEDTSRCDDSFGLATVEMQIASPFLEAGWDFIDETANGTDDIWWILEWRDYPRLWWERGDESPL